MSTGFRVRRRERFAGDIRTLRPGDAGLPGQGQGHAEGEGVRVHQLPRPERCRKGVREDRRL